MSKCYKRKTYTLLWNQYWHLISFEICLATLMMAKRVSWSERIQVTDHDTFLYAVSSHLLTGNIEINFCDILKYELAKQHIPANFSTMLAGMWDTFFMRFHISYHLRALLPLMHFPQSVHFHLKSPSVTLSIMELILTTRWSSSSLRVIKTLIWSTRMTDWSKGLREGYRFVFLITSVLPFVGVSSYMPSFVGFISVLACRC